VFDGPFDLGHFKPLGLPMDRTILDPQRPVGVILDAEYRSCCWIGQVQELVPIAYHLFFEPILAHLHCREQLTLTVQSDASLDRIIVVVELFQGRQFSAFVVVQRPLLLRDTLVSSEGFCREVSHSRQRYTTSMSPSLLRNWITFQLPRHLFKSSAFMLAHERWLSVTVGRSGVYTILHDCGRFTIVSTIISKFGRCHLLPSDCGGPGQASCTISEGMLTHHVNCSTKGALIVPTGTALLVF